MATTLKEVVRLTRFFRNLPGGSKPILARASDGHLYVVKFGNNPQGTNLLFNESIGTELYRTSGLFVSFWKPLLVTDSFVDGNPGCWMSTPEGYLRPQSGLCFGSRFLGGDGPALLEILPGNRFQRVSNRLSFWLAWMIDICAEHADNRQAIFLENRTGRLRAFFIDHGNLFGGAGGEKQPHFMESRYLDPQIYPELSSELARDLLKIVQSLDVDELRLRMDELPDVWKTKSAIDRFERCLGNLSSSELLWELADTLVEASKKNAGSSGRIQLIEPEPPILRPTIQAALQDRQPGRYIAHSIACS